MLGLNGQKRVWSSRNRIRDSVVEQADMNIGKRDKIGENGTRSGTITIIVEELSLISEHLDIKYLNVDKRTASHGGSRKRKKDMDT